MAKGIEVRGKSIRVYFRYEGKLCRETLDLEPTQSNIEYAEYKVKQIEIEIQQDRFDYGSHFPESANAIENTFGYYLDLWASMKKNEVAPSTYLSYESRMNFHIKPRWKTVAISKIDHIDIQQWVKVDLMPKLHNKTIREIISCMFQVFALYCSREKTAINPAQGISIRMPDSEDPDPFTRTEIARMLDTPGAEPQEYNLIQFMVWTGARVSEILALAWEDIDLDNGLVNFRRSMVRSEYRVTKTKRSKREIKALQPAIDALLSQKQLTDGAQPHKVEVLDWDNKTKKAQRLHFVWLNPITGNHYAYHDLRYLFTKQLARAEIRYRGPGQCRHTFASQLLSSGLVSPAWVATQLGHLSTKMIFEHYGKWIREDGPDYVALLNDAMNLKGEKQENSQNVPKGVP